MGSLRALAARLRAADEARHATKPPAEGETPPPADDAADLAHEAAVMVAAREAEAAGAYPTLPEAEHGQALAGMMRAALMRPPAWAERPDCHPPPGAWCGGCSRQQPEAGGRWWQEAVAPKGWRCATCYPPPSHRQTRQICGVSTFNAARARRRAVTDGNAHGCGAGYAFNA